MKYLRSLATAIALLAFAAQPSFAAVARITAKPQDEAGRPKDPIYVIPVKEDGTIGPPTTAVTCALCATAAKQDDQITLETAISSAISAMSAKLPSSLGAKTGALSLSVVPNTDTPFPASQSGTWNITNVSGTVSLPTGAATAAKQPALGTVGVPSADVLTTQRAINSTVTTAQTTVGTTETSILAASTTKIHREIYNTDASKTMYIGPTGVTTSTGFPVPPGYSFDASEFSGQLFGIVASGSMTAASIQW